MAKPSNVTAIPAPKGHREPLHGVLDSLNDILNRVHCAAETLNQSDAVDQDESAGRASAVINRCVKDLEKQRDALDAAIAA
jgi:hypothetical protein